MDEADIAQRNNELYERMALQAHAAARPSGLAARTCEECDAPIPEARRRAAPGCTRCITCQEQFERKERRN